MVEEESVAHIADDFMGNGDEKNVVTFVCRDFLAMYKKMARSEILANIFRRTYALAAQHVAEGRKVFRLMLSTEAELSGAEAVLWLKEKSEDVKLVIFRCGADAEKWENMDAYRYANICSRADEIVEVTDKEQVLNNMFENCSHLLLCSMGGTLDAELTEAVKKYDLVVNNLCDYSGQWSK